MSSKLLVSVCMITYNHEEFIQEAIEGVLMQHTNFDIELIISNDCSTDGTDVIIRDLILKNNNISINYNSQNPNLGMMANFIVALKKCKGKYIALCEGDDYWTDPLKLQKQVDFLEAKPEINICFHRANLLENNVLRLHPIPSGFEEKSFDYKELLENYNFIATASVVLRNKYIEFPSWFHEVNFGDLSLYKIYSDEKKIACINENMCVYRIHSDGVWSGLEKIESKIYYLNFYKQIYFYLNLQEKKVVFNKMLLIIHEISHLKFSNNRIFIKLDYWYNRIK